MSRTYNAVVVSFCENSEYLTGRADGTDTAQLELYDGTTMAILRKDIPLEGTPDLKKRYAFSLQLN